MMNRRALKKYENQQTGDHVYHAYAWGTDNGLRGSMRMVLSNGAV